MEYLIMSLIVLVMFILGGKKNNKKTQAGWKEINKNLQSLACSISASNLLKLLQNCVMF